MSVQHYRSVDLVEVGDKTVVRFVDRYILEEQTQVIGKELFKLVKDLAGKKIILDLGDVEYFSSTTLGLILQLHRKVRDTGGRLDVCNVDPSIYEISEIIKFSKGDDEPGEGLGGVASRSKTPKPSGSQPARAVPPVPESE